MKIPQGVTFSDLNKMSLIKARKLIAQDALLWLEMPQIKPTEGVFATHDRANPIAKTLDPADWPHIFSYDAENKDAREVLEKDISDNETCAVCAVGLATIAAAYRFNSIKACELDMGTGMKTYLSGFFRDLVYDMEAIFEGWGRLGNLAKDKIPQEKDRLRFVFEAIIKDTKGLPNFRKHLQALP